MEIHDLTPLFSLVRDISTKVGFMEQGNILIWGIIFLIN